MTEDELLAGIIDAASLGGWRVYHIRRSDQAIIQGASSIGFPDLILANARRRPPILAFECKSEFGRTTFDQDAWLAELTACGVSARVVRPADYEQVYRFLLEGQIR